MAMVAGGTGREWQDTIRARLMERQAEGQAYGEVVQQFQQLARSARELKRRNKALLHGGLHAGGSPILAHLDAELAHLRAELSTVYRSQAAAQNKQLALSDALRDRDQEVRGLREQVRELRLARDAGARREKDLEDRWKARTKDMEVLNDEVLSLSLEIHAVTQRNAALQADNASLLQRWIDKMNLAADEMNVEFEKEAGRATGQDG